MSALRAGEAPLRPLLRISVLEAETSWTRPHRSNAGPPLRAQAADAGRFELAAVLLESRIGSPRTTPAFLARSSSDWFMTLACSMRWPLDGRERHIDFAVAIRVSGNLEARVMHGLGASLISQEWS